MLSKGEFESAKFGYRTYIYMKLSLSYGIWSRIFCLRYFEFCSWYDSRRQWAISHSLCSTDSLFRPRLETSHHSLIGNQSRLFFHRTFLWSRDHFQLSELFEQIPALPQMMNCEYDLEINAKRFFFFFSQIG